MDLDKESLRKAALGFACVTEIVVYSVSGYALGSYLDRWINTDPLFSALFTLLGLIGGFYRLYRVMKQDDDPGKGDKSA